MLMLFRRMLTYFTLICCLVVGTFAIRVMVPRTTVITFDPSVLNVFMSAEMVSQKVPELQLAEINFEQIKFDNPRVRQVVKVSGKERKVLAPVAPLAQVALPEVKITSRHELPFAEAIEVPKIYYTGSLLTNLVALFKELPADSSQREMIAKSEFLADEVKTVQAKEVAMGDEAEPVFFDYEDESAKEEAAVPATAASADMVPDASHRNEAPVPVTEEINVEDMVGFDYAKAKADVSSQNVPAVSGVVSTQATKPGMASWRNTPKTKKVHPAPKVSQTDKYGPEALVEKNPLMKEEEPLPGLLPDYSSTIVEAVGTDLKGHEKLNNFEVRFHDDYSEMKADYGDGKVALENTLAHPKMTRAIRLLKPSFAPTSYDLILEQEGGEATVPMLDSETFNTLLAPYEVNGPIGAVLIELDDNTETVELDSPYGKSLYLNGDLRETSDKDYRYQLFVGVRAGNVLVNYTRSDRRMVTKIIHVHSHETTFDNNFYEEASFNTVKMYEENLLSKEKSPLLISSQQVRVFATEKKAKKANDHTFKINFGPGSLAGRRYLELAHQAEPVFIGLRNKAELQIPDETFMRHMLSQIEGRRLGSRCLVQVNLSKKATDFSMGSESVEDSLMITSQALDSDGRFYDSLSEKTRKIIIVGEAQGPQEFSPDSKINLKINYVDGSVEYLSSYCSPNTYMVEQL